MRALLLMLPLLLLGGCYAYPPYPVYAGGGYVAPAPVYGGVVVGRPYYGYPYPYRYRYWR